MRIWYVVGDKEYWLEPEYQERKNHRFTVLGCRMYTPEGTYKGYWHWSHIPLVVKRQVREALANSIKREADAKVRVSGYYRRVGRR
jgi:hypothetical protein